MGLKEAIFAGGCFWCMEATFERQPGVFEAIAGYTGEKLKTPPIKLLPRMKKGT
ncbi:MULTISPECIES: peptide-methionine (S)-S-oxide reductase [Thermococcus]|uniref:peptide-methionine (S)-S-oxide reductase n=1 Tax=Thermococcus TaxID=2263 RepID=UPI001E526F5F|nr:peptide-methionine (S)-S-oxide reductase [Thermococcus sibiricus]